VERLVSAARSPTPGDGGQQQPAPTNNTTDVRYLDPVALLAWLAQTADSIGLDHATIDRLQAQVVHEAERHPARMVEARTLRRVLPRPT